MKKLQAWWPEQEAGGSHPLPQAQRRETELETVWSLYDLIGRFQGHSSPNSAAPFKPPLRMATVSKHVLKHLHP